MAHVQQWKKYWTPVNRMNLMDTTSRKCLEGHVFTKGKIRTDHGHG
jgi:hypothetical protein